MLSLNKRSKSRSRTKVKRKEGSRERSSLYRSRTKVKRKEGSRERSSLPKCRPVLYCGNNNKAPSKKGYDRVGKKEECFKKGFGVGMMIEMNKIKSKLASKGIILVTQDKQKEECMDKRGRIKTQYKK